MANTVGIDIERMEAGIDKNRVLLYGLLNYYENGKRLRISTPPRREEDIVKIVEGNYLTSDFTIKDFQSILKFLNEKREDIRFPSDESDIDRRSPSPRGGLRSPSPRGGLRSPSPRGGLRSPSPRGGLRSPSPGGDLRSPSPRGGLRSPSPRGGLRSPSPRGGLRSPSPRGGRMSLSSNTVHMSPSQYSDRHRPSSQGRGRRQKRYDYDDDSSSESSYKRVPPRARGRIHRNIGRNITRNRSSESSYRRSSPQTYRYHNRGRRKTKRVYTEDTIDAKCKQKIDRARVGLDFVLDDDSDSMTRKNTERAIKKSIDEQIKTNCYKSI